MHKCNQCDVTGIVTCPLVPRKQEDGSIMLTVIFSFEELSSVLLYLVSYRHICECRGRRLIVSGHWTVQSGERERERECCGNGE